MTERHLRTVWAKAFFVLSLCWVPTVALAQLTAPATSTGTYTVSWTASSGGQTRAYLYESANQGAWTSLTVTGTNSRKFTKPQGTYAYKLQLCFYEPEIKQELCEPFSDEVTVVVTTAPGIPGVPGSLGGDVTNTTGTYTLSWGPASGTVTRYELEERMDPGLWNRIHNDSTRTRTITRADGSYDYRVRACNAAGCGGYTGVTRVTVLKIPGVPGSLGPDTTTGPIGYVISWDASPGTVSRYELHERMNGGSWAIVHNSPARSRTFTNKPRAMYEYRVRACNASGCSAFTAIKRVTVAPEENIAGPTASSGCYTLRWDPSPDEAELQQRSPGGAWQSILKSRQRTSLDVCTCTSGVYQYRLRHCIPPEPGFPGFCFPWGQTHNVDVAFPGHIRPNIASLDPNGPEIAALRRGIEVMRSRAATDPTSWIYQANMHGTNDRPLQPAWNTCQHGSWFFLSWHRMYLYYFERILRAASGDATLALPYWDYSDTRNPDARRLPLPFRTPADASNALFEPQRSAAMNAGGTLPGSAVTFSGAFARTNFSSPTGSGQSFGGQVLSAPAHNGLPHSVFERTPHDTVHGNIGGFMGSFAFAARDPIFWLHHANIDRLWERWLDQGGGRANPTDSAWLTQAFQFFDENGQSATLSGQQIVDIAGALNYCYGDRPSVVRRVAEASPVASGRAEEAERPRRLAASTPGLGVELRGQPATVVLTIREAEALVRTEGLTVLNVEGITFDQPPHGHYEIYLNLPAGETPDYRGRYYVGNLTFFGLEPHGEAAEPAGPRHAYDITQVVRELRASSAWDDEEATVTFVPRGPEPPPGVIVKREEAVPVRIQRLTITIE